MRRKLDRFLGLTRDDSTLYNLLVPLEGKYDESRSVQSLLVKPPHESLDREFQLSGDEWFEAWREKRSSGLTSKYAPLRLKVAVLAKLFFGSSSSCQTHGIPMTGVRSLGGLGGMRRGEIDARERERERERERD